MNPLGQFGSEFFKWLLQASWQAAILAGLILLAQRLLRKQLSPGWRYGLWFLLLLRLVMPVQPESAFSVFNLTESLHASVAKKGQPTVSLPPIDQVLPIEKIDEQPITSTDANVRAEVVTAAPRPERSSGWRWSWFDWALAFWFGGVVFLGAKLTWTQYRFRARI